MASPLQISNPMNSIYVIFEETGEYEDHTTSPVCYVKTKSAAIKKVKTLRDALPKCPFDEINLKLFQDAQFEWSDDEYRLWCEAEESSKYFDKTKAPHVIDCAKHSEYMQARAREIDGKFIEMLNERYPSLEMTIEKLSAYRDWDYIRYDNKTYFWKEVQAG